LHAEGIIMGKVVNFIPPRSYAFDPEATNALAMAYVNAIRRLRRDGFTDLVRDEVARRIIVAASTGERNPDRLCASAFASMDLASS
jgi:hypothetical protein